MTNAEMLTKQAARMLSLIGLLFSPEDGGSTFLQNIGNVYQTTSVKLNKIVTAVRI
jgi:hypothetical protein